MRGLLGYLRFEAGYSHGRRYPELPHPYRDEFQRDRDRIVHARAFRRLEDKTQVFGSGLSDHFRNRLTHTIEVSQIARTIAAVLGLNEDLTEALALAHDIGHPPFAHAGEDELDTQMRRFGDRFDHNLHALRIVEMFEQRYACFPGLNLTFEVREGIVKHSHDLEPGASGLYGEYLPGLRPPLEAQIIDLADEIAYNSADLDDSYDARMFTLEELLEAVPGYAEVYANVEQHYPGAHERIRFFESVRMVIDQLASGLIEGTEYAVDGAGVESVEEVRQHPERLLVYSSQAAELNASLKKFLRERVYFSAPIREARDRSRRMIRELFDFFLANPDELPEIYGEAGGGEQDDDLPLHRLVCDYIAGMTDGFLERVHRQHIGSLE
jgi:dGTPase